MDAAEALRVFVECDHNVSAAARKRRLVLVTPELAVHAGHLHLVVEVGGVFGGHPQIGRRLLDEHLQVARVVEGKELGRHAGALSVARARIGIKNDLHGWALRVGARLGLLRAAD